MLKTGWGTIEYGGPVSDRLMEVSVPVWNNKDCEELYVQTIHDTNLCAGGEPGKDSCKVRLSKRLGIVDGVDGAFLTCDLRLGSPWYLRICWALTGGFVAFQGDSGGPLLVQMENRRWVTVGIVSWGIKCGEERPAVYTRVNRYLDWIIRNTL